MSDVGIQTQLPTSAQAIGQDQRNAAVMVSQPWYRFFLALQRRVAAIGTFTVNGAGTATGNSQGTAALLSSIQNTIVVVPPGSGVILPNNAIGSDAVVVINGFTNNLNVYPPVGHTILGLPTNVPRVLTPGGGSAFYHTSPTLWGNV